MEKGKKIERRMMILFVSIVSLIAIKVVWVKCAINGQGSFVGEKKEIIHRANYLINKVLTTPQKLLDEMPSGIGAQFQGEWALYSCSMTAAAMTNIAIIYPDNKERAKNHIDKLIEIALSPEIREYDRMRWGEDPLESVNGNKSHVSYLSHIAWMISGYKQIGGDNKYDELYHSLCETMNRRISQSSSMNLPTYPGEDIYMPDMLVAIVALSNYARQNNGQYAETVKKWVDKARLEFVDSETGLLASFLPENGTASDYKMPIKGSYSALNCYYLTFVDTVFAKEQYGKFKTLFYQKRPFAGIREYYNRSCWLGMDIDAGPIIFNLSPSGTGFALGSSTYFQDFEIRNSILKTAEIAGSTVMWFGESHYLLANIALVGEAITLAMRTAVPWFQ